MRLALLTTDNREHYRHYETALPEFGTAIAALLQGFENLPDLEVHIVSCTQRPVNAPEKLGENLWFHSLLVPKIGWLRTGYQGCVRAIRRKLHEIQPDVVHGQGTERECALAAALSGYPNVVTIHGIMSRVAAVTQASFGSYYWWAKLIERVALSRTHGVLCNSSYTESAVAPMARRTWRVANPVRREFFDEPLPSRPLRPTRPVLLNVGGVAEYKRQLALLDLAEQMHRMGHSFELVFVGACDDRLAYAGDFLRRIHSPEAGSFARFVGPKPLAELLPILDAASAMVHVPSEESFGLVVAEALARDVKFFGTEVGGIPDIASGIEAAEVFPLQSPELLRDAITRWLAAGCPPPSSPHSQIEKRYHPALIAKQHLEIYREIIGPLSSSIPR